MDPEDERVMAAFNKPQVAERRSLADIIMEKIKEKEQQLELVPKSGPGGGPGTYNQLDLKIIQAAKGQISSIIVYYRNTIVLISYSAVPSVNPKIIEVYTQ